MMKDNFDIKLGGILDNREYIRTFDQAARGDLDAITDLAEGYLKGTYGKKDEAKALRWCGYAAKKGHPRAIALLETILNQGREGIT